MGTVELDRLHSVFRRAWIRPPNYHIILYHLGNLVFIHTLNSVAFYTFYGIQSTNFSCSMLNLQYNYETI